MAQTSNPADQQEHLSGQQALDKVRSLLKDFHSAMFTTAVAGDVHTRPMGLLGAAENFNGSLWFFTDGRSTKLKEIASGASASLLFQSDAAGAYLQLVGRATEDRDAAKMAELYTPRVTTWFPGGLADPHLTLVRFDAERGSFWDTPGGIVRALAAFTKAILTGTPAAVGAKGAVDLG
jgi:general stress protein 26